MTVNRRPIFEARIDPRFWNRLRRSHERTLHEAWSSFVHGYLEADTGWSFHDPGTSLIVQIGDRESPFWDYDWAFKEDVPKRRTVRFPGFLTGGRDAASMSRAEVLQADETKPSARVLAIMLSIARRNVAQVPPYLIQGLFGSCDRVGEHQVFVYVKNGDIRASVGRATMGADVPNRFTAEKAEPDLPRQLGKLEFGHPEACSGFGG